MNHNIITVRQDGKGDYTAITPGGKAADNGNHGIRQLIRHAAVKGDKFGISDEPGYLEKDALPVIMKCVAPNLVKF